MKGGDVSRRGHWFFVFCPAIAGLPASSVFTKYYWMTALEFGIGTISPTPLSARPLRTYLKALSVYSGALGVCDVTDHCKVDTGTHVALFFKSLSILVHDKAM